MTVSPFKPNQIDALVKAALAADAQEVDVASLEALIAARVGGSARHAALAGPPRQRNLLPWNPARVLRWTAAAACLLVAAGVAGHLSFSPSSASAESLVRSAHSAFAPAADRRYEGEFSVDTSWRNTPITMSADRVTVWTRGDRFQVMMVRGADRIVWGRDENQQTWGVVGNRAAVYERGELPPLFAESLALLNLDLYRLTRDLLSDYELRTVRQDDEAPNTVTIVARPRSVPGSGDAQRKPPYINSIRLVIDKPTKVIRQVELARVVRGKRIARFHFTLIEEGTRSDASYRLEGNRPADCEIFDKGDRGQRAGLLLEAFAS